MMEKKTWVALIMGSSSDWPVMQSAAEVLQDLGISFEKKVVSAHRTPKLMMSYAESAMGRGCKVIIAGAGGAAHLPGMVASLTTLPVLGVPIVATPLQGLDSLLSIVQMPRGIPVGCLAINQAANAAWLAARILAISDKSLQKKIDTWMKKEALRVNKQKL
jgi:5-(carboxyamino)imidazole ribonucleotide mutase